MSSRSADPIATAAPPRTKPDFRVAADLVDQERERLALLISEQLPLSDVDRAFQLAADKTRGAVKITVRPGL